MKRSEMVKILQTSFIFWMNCTEDGLTPKNDDELFCRILGDLEKAGMLPPFCEEVYDKIGDFGHEWEPE